MIVGAGYYLDEPVNATDKKLTYHEQSNSFFHERRDRDRTNQSGRSSNGTDKGSSDQKGTKSSSSSKKQSKVKKTIHESIPATTSGSTENEYLAQTDVSFQHGSMVQVQILYATENGKHKYKSPAATAQGNFNLLVTMHTCIAYDC